MHHTYFAVIPARSGSKSVPHKNIRDFHGRPLMAWSIFHAQQCPHISDIYVTTDSDQYAEIARHYGAKVVMRPLSCSDDHSTDLEFFQHLIQHGPNSAPDAWIQLRPTCPRRNPATLSRMIELFDTEWDQWTSLRTVTLMDKSPYKMYRVQDSRLVPLFNTVDGRQEPYNECRQVLPLTYLHNGNIDIVKSSTILNHRSVTGPHIRCWIDGDPCIDIDTETDFQVASAYGLPAI